MSDHSTWQRKVSDDARRYAELRDRVAGLSVTETSRNGLVKVTVSSSGALTGLEMPGSLAGVAADVLECVRRAQARIPALLQDTAAETVGAANAQAALRDGPPDTTPVVNRDPQEVAVFFDGQRIMMARDVLSLDPTAADAARSVEDSLLRLSPFVRLSEPTTGELLVQVPNGTSTQDLEGLLGRVTAPQEQIRVQFRDHDGKVLGTFGR